MGNLAKSLLAIIDVPKHMEFWHPKERNIELRDKEELYLEKVK